MAQRKSTPVWVWVATGCGVALVLALIAAGGVIWVSYRMAKQIEREIEDPVARADKALEVLGGDELPPGYYPVMAISIPFLMDMAMLSDVEPPPGPQGSPRFDERGFLWVEVFATGGQRREVDDFLAGRIDDAEFLRRSSINLYRGEVLGRGSLEVDGVEVRYVAQQGSISFEGAHDHEGLTTTVAVQCPGSGRLRLGMWFGPGVESPADVEPPDLTGTTADPVALADFLGHFRLCG